MSIVEYYAIQHAQPMQWFIYMYYGLFVCTMYDSYGHELCIIYDSHDVYLRASWTICMYKFSRCHTVVFYGFFFAFTDFLQNSPGFWQNSPGNHHDEFREKSSIYW
jgi:hypothetical protein